MINNVLKKSFLTICLFCLSSSLVFGEFVLGIYCVDDINELSTIKEAGFNVVQTYNTDPEYIDLLATKAKENELKILVYPTKIIGSKYQQKVSQYPLLAWYIYDEPDVWNLSKDKLLEINNNCKKSFPNDKTAFVIGEGFTETPFYDVADILMVDWYPVPHLPLESLGKNVALAKQGVTMVEQENKPLWAVIQLFDWKEYKQYRKDDDRIGRFPKKEEIRFMSYDAIVNGATGLFYFNYKSEKKPLPQSKPKQWQEVVDVIQELSFIAEIIDNGKEIENPIEIEEPLKIKSFEYGGIKYTILVNPTSKRQTVPRLFFNPKFDVMYEKSTNLKKIMGKGHNNFKPYKALVFRYE